MDHTLQRINEANEVLSDSYKRMVYDMEIRNTPASGIQSDGFDRWYQKERDREAERAGESRRLRDAEQERRQVRDLERDKAIAAHEALRARRQQARDARAAAEEVWQQQRRDAAQAQAQARAASKARAQAAVSRAEDHMRSVQALATAHTAALDSSRQQVTNAKRQARAVQLEAVSARPATGNGVESSPRQAASPPEAVVPPARLISKASHARGDAVDSPKPAHVPARNQPGPAASPPVTANQSTPAASPVPGDVEGDAGAPRRARGGQSASSRLGIRPGIVGERAAMFAGTPESGSAAAPSGGGDDRDRARAAASGGTNSTASFASSYFNSPSADSYDGEAEPTTAEAKAEAERRASVLRARTLARRVEAENLQELDRLRQQQERDAQYVPCAGCLCVCVCVCVWCVTYAVCVPGTSAPPHALSSWSENAHAAVRLSGAACRPASRSSSARWSVSWLWTATACLELREAPAAVTAARRPTLMTAASTSMTCCSVTAAATLM